MSEKNMFHCFYVIGVTVGFKKNKYKLIGISWLCHFCQSTQFTIDDNIKNLRSNNTHTSLQTFLPTLKPFPKDFQNYLNHVTNHLPNLITSKL